MLGRHLLVYLPVNLAQAIVGFGGVVVLTRLMSTQEYGLYAQALAAMYLAHAPVFIWLESAAARFHARAARRGRLADHMAALYAALAPLALGAMLLLGLVLTLAPLSAEVKTIAGFAGAALVARAAMKISQETRRAAHEAGRYAFLETFYSLGGFAIGVMLIAFTPLRAAGPFVGLAVATLVCVALEAPAMARRARGGRVDRRRIAAYWRYGAPLALSQILVLILAMSDRFMIGAFLGDGAVGTYFAGYALADRTLDILFIWIGMAAAPIAIAQLERAGRAGAVESLRAQAETMVLITLPAAVGLALVAGPLTTVMTGAAFREQAAQIVPWIAAAGFLGGFTTYYLELSLELSRRTHLLLLVLVWPALLNIALNLALIPLFGITGAVAATVIAYALRALLTWLIGRRRFPLPLPWGAFARTAAACAAMAAAVLLVPPPEAAWLQLIVEAGVGGAVFALAALALDAGPARAFAAAGLAALRRGRTAEAAP